MVRRRHVLAVLATVLVAGIVGWHVVAPGFGMLGWIVLGPLLWMVVERMLGEWQTSRLAERLERFDSGRCTRCGYDLRASRERCPECGRPRERPEAPLPRVTAKPWSSARRAEVDEAEWLMALREPSTGAAWRTDEERRVAAIIERASCQVGGWPNGRFLPDDPFATMIEDWEGMVYLDISIRLERELNVELSEGDYPRFLTMTFGEVVAELAGRVGTTRVEEPTPAAGRFVSSPGRVGLLPPPWP